MPPTLHLNDKLHRFELTLENVSADAVTTAFAVFHAQPGGLVITHTEVPAALQGRGIGGQLVRAVLDDIAARGLKVVPRCPFVADWIAKHPEYRALLA